MLVLAEVVNDIVTVNQRLQHFERKYGILSSEFYQTFNKGELAEFDGDAAYHDEFMAWAALYQTQQKLYREYQRLSQEQPVVARIRSRLAFAA